MTLLRLYTRVLELLGKESRLGWILAGANLLLAAAQFAEPVLFGRIVAALSGKAVLIYKERFTRICRKTSRLIPPSGA